MDFEDQTRAIDRELFESLTLRKGGSPVQRASSSLRESRQAPCTSFWKEPVISDQLSVISKTVEAPKREDRLKRMECWSDGSIEFKPLLQYSNIP
jgi:hypothetical protein